MAPARSRRGLEIPDPDEIERGVGQLEVPGDPWESPELGLSLEHHRLGPAEDRLDASSAVLAYSIGNMPCRPTVDCALAG